MVRDFEDARARGGELWRDRALDLGADIARQEQRDVAARHLQHHGVVVTDTRALPVWLGWVQHANTGVAQRKRFSSSAHGHGHPR